uniref:Putative secreted protein n=1 Tax=Ixodes ricinus TaxID=34613 RepID=A0A6B0UBS0_IXORI
MPPKSPVACLSLASVQALAMVRFMSSSPSSYICFIMVIKLELGSLLSTSGFGTLGSLAFFSASVTWDQSWGLDLRRKTTTISVFTLW